MAVVIVVISFETNIPKTQLVFNSECIGIV